DPAPGAMAGQSPPHVETRRDPHNDSEAHDVDDDAPGTIQQTFLLEAAAAVHAGQELIPPKATILDGDALLIGVVLQLRRFPERVRVDVDLVWTLPIRTIIRAADTGLAQQRGPERAQRFVVVRRRH